MHTSTSGGSSETEVNELAVKPRGRPAPSIAVTTVTPVTKQPNARRSSSESNGVGASATARLPQDEGIGHRLGGQIDPGRFRAGVVEHGFETAFTAKATPAVAAERHHGRDGAIGVDPDDARAQALHHPQTPGAIVGEDAGREAVVGVVGE